MIDAMIVYVYVFEFHLYSGKKWTGPIREFQVDRHHHHTQYWLVLSLEYICAPKHTHIHIQRMSKLLMEFV